MAISRSILVTAAAAALALGGCGDGAKQPQARPDVHPTSSSAAKVRLADPVGAAVLSIAMSKTAPPVVADFAALDAISTQTYDIYEPFDKKQISFKGVELSAVLDAAGVPASATKIRMVALDEYLVDLKLADVRAGGVILATQADGAPMPIAKGGPVRIVFLDDAKDGKNTDNWIWSLSRIEVS